MVGDATRHELFLKTYLFIDQTVRILGTHVNVQSMVALPNGDLVSGSSSDGSIKIWDTTTGLVKQTLSDNRSSIECMAILPNQYGGLASGSNDFKIRIWNVTSGQVLRVLSGHTDWVISLAVLPGGLLASGSRFRDYSIKIWNLETGKVKATIAYHE